MGTSQANYIHPNGHTIAPKNQSTDWFFPNILYVASQELPSLKALDRDSPDIMTQSDHYLIDSLTHVSQPCVMLG